VAVQQEELIHVTFRDLSLQIDAGATEELRGFDRLHHNP